MPELPEIETVKLQLQKVLIGQELIRIEQLHHKSLQGDVTKIQGKKIVAVKRFGKMLVTEVDSTSDSVGTTHKGILKQVQDDKRIVIACHFKMSGQLILVKSNQKSVNRRIVGGHPTADWFAELPSKHTRVIFHFKSGDTLYFNDQRIFGWVKILTQEELLQLPFMQKLGKEIWELSDAAFYDLIHGKKRSIKILLMDQELLSGVGNIYANDALWEAKIYPERTGQSISSEEAKLLRYGLIKVLDEGITYGGATAADAKYMNLHGMGGTYQEHFRTYDRTGESCLRKDGGIIQKITLGGRGTYFCPVCQK